MRSLVGGCILWIEERKSSWTLETFFLLLHQIYVHNWETHGVLEHRKGSQSAELSESSNTNQADVQRWRASLTNSFNSHHSSYHLSAQLFRNFLGSIFAWVPDSTKNPNFVHSFDSIFDIAPLNDLCARRDSFLQYKFPLLQIALKKYEPKTNNWERRSEGGSARAHLSFTEIDIVYHHV